MIKKRFYRTRSGYSTYVLRENKRIIIECKYLIFNSI